MATSLPVFSVIFRVLTPLPPLLVILYSSKSVLLPNPFSLTTSTLWAAASSAVGSYAIEPITLSSSSIFIPLTPEAVRPIGLASVSSKRQQRPSMAATSIWLLPFVRTASKSSSPSLTVMALIPLARGLEYASRVVFLIMPLLVVSIT